MFSISKNGIITVSRGDDFTLNTSINIGTVFNPCYYDLQDEDLVYFALMEPNQPFEHALIRKVFTSADKDFDGSIVMNFTMKDTEFLVPGTYYYMIKLKRLDSYESDGESGYEPIYKVDTIVTKTKFIVCD